MQTLKELIEARKALLGKIDAILEKPEARDAEGKETGELTDEQRKTYESHKNELRDLDTKIEDAQEREENRRKQARLEDEARQVVTPRYTGVQDRLSRGERRDVNRFSVPRMLGAMVEGRAIDGVEAEMLSEGKSETRQSSIQISRNAVMVPSFAVLSDDETRDMTATGGTGLNQGGMTIETNKAPMLDDLFNKMVLTQAGMTEYTGLVGNLDIPRISKGTDPAHKSENGSADETSPTTSQLSLSPKRLPVQIDVSRQLFMQGQERNLDTAIRRNIIGQISEIIQRKLINGGGANEPTGILKTSGIGSVVGGSAGAVPTFANIVGLETEVSIDDADIGNLHYLTNTAVRGKLKGTPKVASTDSVMIWGENNMLNGYVPLVSNGVPDDLTKASGTNLSAIIFGNFLDLVMAQWSGIEFIVDEVTQAGSGLIRLHAAIYYDGGVQRPQSFAAMQDAITT